VSFLFAEMTREEIRQVAPSATAVLPTAAIEQHGPHLPVCTDTVLCETVARQAAARANEHARVVVAPTLQFGNSHHHYPFPGVLSLKTTTFVGAVTDVLEGLVRSGFKRLVVLNGHGGNSNPNGLAGQDFVNRLGNPAAVATGDYWNIAREALTDVMPSKLIPGHAGRFEAALIMAVRPDLVNREALDAMSGQVHDDAGLDVGLSGAVVQVHGEWQSGVGYTDNPADATAEEGRSMLDIIIRGVSDFFVAFHRSGHHD
jgi:creatinine amidohydrolase